MNVNKVKHLAFTLNITQSIIFSSRAREWGKNAIFDEMIRWSGSWLIDYFIDDISNLIKINAHFMRLFITPFVLYWFFCPYPSKWDIVHFEHILQNTDSGSNLFRAIFSESLFILLLFPCILHTLQWHPKTPKKVNMYWSLP